MWIIIIIWFNLNRRRAEKKFRNRKLSWQMVSVKRLWQENMDAMRVFVLFLHVNNNNNSANFKTISLLILPIPSSPHLGSYSRKVSFGDYSSNISILPLTHGYEWVMSWYVACVHVPCDYDEDTQWYWATQPTMCRMINLFPPCNVLHISPFFSHDTIITPFRVW